MARRAKRAAPKRKVHARAVLAPAPTQNRPPTRDRPIGGVAQRYQRETHPLVGATPERCASILLEAARGLPARLQDLYDDMRDRDLRLDAVCRTRTHAITSRPWRVRPPDGYEKDKDALEIARRVQSLVKRIRAASRSSALGGLDLLGGGWHVALSNIVGGVLCGYSVSQPEWQTSAEGWHYPARLEWLHPNRFSIGSDLGLRYAGVATGAVDGGTALTDYGRDRFVVHAPCGGRASYVTRSGPLLSCVFSALTKRLGMRWLVVAAERFGTPLPYATLPPGSSTALSDQAKDMLRAFNADWQAVVSAGIKIDVVPMTGQATGDIHARIVDLANNDYAIQLLGQNLNAEVKGGSYAAAAAGGVLRMDLLGGDLAELDDTITQQIVEPIVRYNWPGAPVPVYETELAPKSSKEIFAYHIAAGVVSPDEVRAGLGLDPLPNGQGASMIPAQIQPGAAPAAVPGGALAGNPFPAGSAKALEWEAEMLARRATTTSQTSQSEPTTTRPAHPLARALAS